MGIPPGGSRGGGGGGGGGDGTARCGGIYTAGGGEVSVGMNRLPENSVEPR